MKRLLASVRSLFIATKPSSFDLAMELENEINKLGMKLFKEATNAKA
jgi:hypothetical protein